MKSKESEIVDVAADDFLNSGDVIDALNMWKRGFYTDADLIDKLRHEAAHSDRRATDYIEDPSRPDDPLAKTGTWCAHDPWNEEESA